MVTTAGSLADKDCIRLRAVSTEEALPPLMAEASEEDEDMAEATFPMALLDV